jgi:hypothetical protein
VDGPKKENRYNSTREYLLSGTNYRESNMNHFIRRSVIFGTGIGLGAVVACLAVWTFLHPYDSHSGRPGHLIGVQATASASNDAFSVATGRIDENIEALFLLDALTGELTCNVMSIFTGKFFARFSRNVLNDLGTDKTKNARLLMVTGFMSFKNQTGQMGPADTVVYVVDSVSGNFAAYTIPWHKNISSRGRQKNHIGEIRLWDRGKSRKIQVRPS